MCDDGVVEGLPLDGTLAGMRDTLHRKFEAECLPRLTTQPIDDFFDFDVQLLRGVPNHETRVVVVFSVTQLLESPTHIWAIKDRDKESGEYALLKKKGILKMMSPTDVALLVHKRLSRRPQRTDDARISPSASQQSLSSLQQQPQQQPFDYVPMKASTSPVTARAEYNAPAAIDRETFEYIPRFSAATVGTPLPRSAAVSTTDNAVVSFDYTPSSNTGSTAVLMPVAINTSALSYASAVSSNISNSDASSVSDSGLHPSLINDGASPQSARRTSNVGMPAQTQTTTSQAAFFPKYVKVPPAQMPSSTVLNFISQSAGVLDSASTPSPPSQLPVASPNAQLLTLERIVRVLRTHLNGLELREIVLYALNKDPHRDKPDPADVQHVKKVIAGTPGIKPVDESAKKLRYAISLL